MWESQVSGCQLNPCIEPNAQATPSQESPFWTTGLACT